MNERMISVNLTFSASAYNQTRRKLTHIRHPQGSESVHETQAGTEYGLAPWPHLGQIPHLVNLFFYQSHTSPVAHPHFFSGVHTPQRRLMSPPLPESASLCPQTKHHHSLQARLSSIVPKRPLRSDCVLQYST